MADAFDQPSFAAVLSQAMSTLSNAIRFQGNLQREKEALQQKFELEREQLSLQRESLELRQQIAAAKVTGEERDPAIEADMNRWVSAQISKSPEAQGKSVPMLRKELSDSERQLTQLSAGMTGQLHALEMEKFTAGDKIIDASGKERIPGDPTINALTLHIQRLKEGIQIRRADEVRWRELFPERARRLGFEPAAPQAAAPAPAPPAVSTISPQVASTASTVPTMNSGERLRTFHETLRAIAPSLKDPGARKKFVSSTTELLLDLRKIGGFQYENTVNSLLRILRDDSGDPRLLEEVYLEFDARIKGQ